MKRVNFPVVGFAAHAVAAICYFAASVILIYALTADDDNPLFVPKDRKRFNSILKFYFEFYFDIMIWQIMSEANFGLAKVINPIRKVKKYKIKF